MDVNQLIACRQDCHNRLLDDLDVPGANECQQSNFSTAAANDSAAIQDFVPLLGIASWLTDVLARSGRAKNLDLLFLRPVSC